MAHLAFEALAYAVGFALYRLQRRGRGDFLPDSTRWTLIVAVVVGAVVGSRVLHHAAHPAELAARWAEGDRVAFLLFLSGGKTIVGALLGGWLAVELTKAWLGVRRATGDLYALPLAVGIAVGRVGCFLSGLEDGTHGAATGAGFGVEFGDGVLRHPVRLYEIAFLVVIALVLARRPRFLRGEGDAFRFFLASYLGFRLVVDGWKPVERFGGLGVLQWACLAGLLVYAYQALTPARERLSPTTTEA